MKGSMMGRAGLAAIAAAGLLMVACTPRPPSSPGEVDQVGVAFVAALAGEAAASVRCPRNIAELAALSTARILFDVEYGDRLSKRQRSAVAAARDNQARACGNAGDPMEVGATGAAKSI